MLVVQNRKRKPHEIEKIMKKASKAYIENATREIENYLTAVALDCERKCKRKWNGK